MREAGERSVRVGCSGWNYASWRHGVFYPERCPARLWLEFYSRRFDTVEVNATFYRLPTVKAVQGWVDQTPDDFLFTVKASRYLTHIKRLTELGPGLERFYERIEPLARSPKLGPVLWQLPPTFKRDDDRLAGALARLPPGSHAWEFRHESWFAEDVFALLREHGAALVLADDSRRRFGAGPPTADWAFLRFHHGARGRRGNYSEAELADWAERIEALESPAYAYFNNDWEGFAPRNALRLKKLLEATL
jgi:uncharacterized protein YecE (DUF72 family)